MHWAYFYGSIPSNQWYVRLPVLYRAQDLFRILQRSHMEVIARTEYMAGDSRDPVASSLFYFALGKHKLVQGLWRQAAWHKEQAVMLQFLSNDFTQPRWQTAALKNAYALLGKRRFGERRYLTFGHQPYGEDARIRGCIFHPWR